MSSNRLILTSVFLFSLTAAAQSSPPIPATYQSLYTELQGDVTSFSQAISAYVWNGSYYPTAFASQLLTANSDLGPTLLNADYFQYNVLPELQELKALGVTVVSVHINFPVLYEPYYGSQQTFQTYVSFYQQVAQQIHSMGMKMAVEATVAAAEPGTNGSTFQTYYQGLTWNEYIAGRAQNAVNVAQLIQPDYMSVITEPDSESQNASQPNAGTPSGSLQELQTILAALQAANVTNVPVGAGAGTWIDSFTTYIQNAISTPVSYIDIHMYSVSNSFPENALTAASMAHAAGLPIAMSETWCKKVSAAQLSSLQNALNSPTIDALDTMSFWEPLDQQYLQSVVSMAQAGQFMFVSPFWTTLYYASMDYGTYGSQSPTAVLEASYSAAINARSIGAFTTLGTAWETMILPSPDTTAPQVPTAPSIGQFDQTLVQVLWNPTTDNVGVAGYNLFRNGTQLYTSSQVNYTDTSVSPSTTYSYQVQAFDAAGNLSALSAPATVTTRAVPDTTPPSVPANLKGTALTDQEISLTWSPSTDNVAVAGYRVLGGATAASLSPIASVTTNSFTDTMSLHPNTAYYFAVEAFDTSRNYSAQSAVITVSTLPDTTPPTVPANVAATGTGNQQVSLSWSPSTDNIHVAGYVVYRGKTSSSLAAVGRATNTTYVDTLSLKPGATNYYSVAAYDEAGNYSAQSLPVAATTLPDTQPPSIPQNLKAVANSDTQISLTWSASTDNIAVAGYRIYGGATATSLSPLASTTTTSFTDTLSAHPNTTYYYVIEAFDTSGNYSAQSAVAHATTLPDTIPPTVPTNVTAKGTGVEQVTLTWSPSTDNIHVSGYVIYRSKTNSSLTAVGSTTTTAYVDTLGLQPDTTYYYSIAAYDEAGNYSAQSPTITAATLADTQPPTVPQHLAAVATSGTEILLSWSPSTDNVAVYHYQIYRGVNAQTLDLIGTSSTTSFDDSIGLKANTAYYYAVSAVDTSGNVSVQSSVISVTNP
jgi:chitodextrinase